MQKHYHISVIGAGLTGLVTALKLAPLCRQKQVKLALVAPRTNTTDKRTTALFMPSIAMMQEIKAWDMLANVSAPLKTMRLIDGTNRLLRAPVTDFKSSELDLPAFGYNVPNQKLIERLEDLIDQNDAIERLDTTLDHAILCDDHLNLYLDNKTSVTTALAVAADGRHSVTREAAGIKTSTWEYPQTALVLNFSHSLPHNNISTEFHTKTGPFTQVPLPPAQKTRDRSSLVWVIPPEEAEIRQSLSFEELATIIEEKMHSCLGKITIETKPQAFALSGMRAACFGQNRVALVGEAGHVFPPIGAQGFNLGLRDIWDIAYCLEHYGDQTFKAENDFAAILNHYNRMRLKDVSLRTHGVDLLNRSLLSDFLPVQAARMGILSAMNQFPTLRRFTMRQGLGSQTLGEQASGKREANFPFPLKDLLPFHK